MISFQFKCVTEDEASRLLSASWTERSEGTNRPPVCHESPLQSGWCRESGLFSFGAWKLRGVMEGGQKER